VEALVDLDVPDQIFVAGGDAGLTLGDQLRESAVVGFCAALGGEARPSVDSRLREAAQPISYQRDR
jgi:hypothetical protein